MNTDPSSPVLDVTKVGRVRPWHEYPPGTRAHACGGGHWHRVADGWKWNGPHGTGSTFPTPGADVMCVTMPGDDITRI